MLIDSHAHLNFEKFKDDWQKIISDCQAREIWVNNIGSQYLTSKRAVEIAEQYQRGIFATVGLHPIHSHEEENFFDYKKYSALAKASKKVVAIGETGLDFYHEQKYFDIQQKTFIEQINLAREFDLPLVIHGRNSQDGKINCYEEIYKIVKKEKVANAVIHCFTGNAEDAKKFLDLGFCIGFTGIITFGRKAAMLQEIAAEVVPLEKMLVETDSPYLAPEPHRGMRNLPQYVEFVARKIAELKKISYDEVKEQTAKNTIKLFKLT